MFKIRLVIAMVLLGFFAPLTAKAVEVGEKLPEVGAIKWFNLPKGKTTITKEDLKGKIVVVVAWLSWAPECRLYINQMVEFQKKYRKKGVVLLAMSPESHKRLSKYLQGDKEMTCIVGAAEPAFMARLGIQAWPVAFVTDPDGNVVFKEHPVTMEPAVDKAIKETPARGKSFLVTGTAKALLKDSDAFYKSKKYEEAYEGYEELIEDFGETKEGKSAKTKLSRMKANSSIMRKIKTAQEERQAMKWLNAARALVQYGDANDAAKYYNRIIKRLAGTKAAKWARSELAAIKSRVTEDIEDEEEEATEDEDSEESDSDDEDSEDSGDDEGDDSDDDDDQ